MTPASNPVQPGNAAMSASSTAFWRHLSPLPLAAAGAFFAGAALAERIEYTPDANPNDNVIGVIVIENNEGSNTQTHVIETDHGPVRIQYYTTINQPYFGPDGQLSGCCPDDVRVTDVPEGVLPSAWEIQVGENGTAEITLFLYVGG